MWAKIELAHRVQAIDKIFYIMHRFLCFLPFQKPNIMVPEIVAHGIGCQCILSSRNELPLQILHIFSSPFSLAFPAYLPNGSKTTHSMAQ